MILKERHFPGVRPFPKVRDLMLALRAREVLLGVATSASGQDSARLQDKAHVRDLMDIAVSSDDAEESKPDPDIVVSALRRTGLGAPRVPMIGDTQYDVEAATRAGIACIAVRSRGWEDLALAGAIAVYEDVAKILQRLDEEPLATWLRGTRAS